MYTRNNCKVYECIVTHSSMQQTSWYSTWSVFTIVCSHIGALHQQDIQHRRQQHNKGIVYYHMHIYKLQTCLFCF